MKRKLFFLSALMLTLFFGSVVSCSTDDCGGGGLIYEIEDFTVRPFDKATDKTVTDVEIEYRDLFISVFYERTYLTHLKLQPFSLVSTAYACSLVPPVTDDLLTGITIFADKDFNSDYKAGSVLNDLFKIDDTVIYPIADFIKFQSEQSYFSDYWLLRLNEAPTTSEPIAFKIELEFTNKKDGAVKTFEQTTTAIKIK